MAVAVEFELEARGARQGSSSVGRVRTRRLHLESAPESVTKRNGHFLGLAESRRENEQRK